MKTRAAVLEPMGRIAVAVIVVHVAVAAGLWRLWQAQASAAAHREARWLSPAAFKSDKP